MNGGAGKAATEPTIRELRRSAEAVELELYAAPSMLYFDGHFPGYPILPGVVQVDWALQLGRRYLSLGTAQARSIQVKFRRPMPPAILMILSLSLGRRGQLAFEYRDADGVCSSGQIGF